MKQQGVSLCSYRSTALLPMFLLTLRTAPPSAQHRFPARWGTKPPRDWLRGLGKEIHLPGQRKSKSEAPWSLKRSCGKTGSHQAVLCSCQNLTASTPIRLLDSSSVPCITSLVPVKANYVSSKGGFLVFLLSWSKIWKHRVAWAI